MVTDWTFDPPLSSSSTIATHGAITFATEDIPDTASGNPPTFVRIDATVQFSSDTLIYANQSGEVILGSVAWNDPASD